MQCYISIYGLEGCPYTRRAQKFCLDKKLDYKLTTVPLAEKQEYKDRYDRERFPIVTARYPWKEEVIGGSDDLEEYYYTSG